MTPPPYPSMVVAVGVAVAASSLGRADAAAVQALHELAVRIDERKPGDNVSLPTLLKLVDALGMTPAARRLLSGGAAGKGASVDGSEGVAGDGGAPSSLERKRAELKARFGGSA